MKELRLGLFAPLSDGGLDGFVELIRLADSLGFYAVWSGEAYGTDAVVPMAYAAAVTERVHLGTSIMQMPARTPAMTAMTAATLDLVSNGRFLLGLGMSGPQVVEGWHGQPFRKPLATTREYVAIVRKALERREPLAHDGEIYQLPFTGPGATGVGKALKIMGRPRPDIPIYIAAIGPRNVRLAAEIGDGFLPHIFSPTRWKSAFGEPLAGVDLERFDVAPTVFVSIGSDINECRDAVRPHLALYIGGMGARGQNFYNDLMRRYGYEAAAIEIQDLFLAGKAKDAAAAIPDEMVDDVALVGPKERIADQLGAWRESPVRTLNLSDVDPAEMRTLAELVH